MNQVKILHCGDVHLGAELSTIGRKATQRRIEIKQTFLNILGICKAEKIQLLLLAGDLFDNVHAKDEMLNEIKSEFESMSETTIVIAPGNHDPLSEDSPYAYENFWSDNVIIFGSEFENVELESLGVRLWGRAFSSSYQIKPMLQDIVAPKDAYINICVLHGDLVVSNQKSDYNPVTKTHIARSKMNYIALGHIHKRSEVIKEGNTFYSYSGCPEGRGFDELGEKGVYIGMLSKDRCDLEFRPTCQRMYIEIRVDISEISNSKMAAEHIIKKMKSKYGEFYTEHLYKVILEGTIENNVYIDVDEIKGTLRDVYFVKIKDRTSIKIDFDSISTDMTLRNLFMQKMLERMELVSPEEREKIETALKLGVKAFSGEVQYNED